MRELPLFPMSPMRPMRARARHRALSDVLNHYRTDVVPSATLDPKLKRQDGTLGIQMSDDEADANIAFLGALPDDHPTS
jgi:cytochrome c peroxidase